MFSKTSSTLIIEIETIANIVLTLINEASGGAFISEKDILTVTYRLLAANVDDRMYWCSLSNARTYLEPAALYDIFADLTITDAYRRYLCSDIETVFYVIEDTVDIYLDRYMPKRTWDIYTLRANYTEYLTEPDIAVPPGRQVIDKYISSLSLINDGDYRIEQWALSEEKSRKGMRRYFNGSILRADS